MLTVVLARDAQIRSASCAAVLLTKAASLADHADLDTACTQRRRPAYGVRFNGSTRGISVEQLLEELRALQVEAGQSPCLPGEFIRVESGMQVRLA